MANKGSDEAGHKMQHLYVLFPKQCMKEQYCFIWSH